MKRDELIKELKDKIGWLALSKTATDDISDFIISRETALMDEIEKPLKEYKESKQCKYNEGYAISNKPHEAIDEALSIIQSRREGK